MLIYDLILEEALVLQAKIQKLARPTKRTTNALKSWTSGTRPRPESEPNPKANPKNQSHEVDSRPLQFMPKSAASTLFDDEKDMVSLHPPGEEDLTTQFVARAFGWLLVVCIPTCNSPD
jgi:hypothetical protein